MSLCLHEGTLSISGEDLDVLNRLFTSIQSDPFRVDDRIIIEIDVEEDEIDLVKRVFSMLPSETGNYQG